MSILNIGVSGLLAAQRSLATTSHNIANAATEGYSRQRTELESRAPLFHGGSYLGQGVQVGNVQRIQDDIVTANLRANLTNNSNAEVRTAFAERVENLLSDESTGLTLTLQNYFSAVQDVASDPTSLPARSVLLSQAETLSERFDNVNDQINEQRAMVNDQMRTAVDEINQYAQSLADLNRRIVSGSSGQGGLPNDLLDQRDLVLNRLAEKIDVSAVRQDDGALNVFIGSGQSLVMGGNARELVAERLTGDPNNLDIGYRTSNGAIVDITRFMTGGEIGALVETRRSVLDTAQNQLGLIGLTLATEFNEQNRLGLDLNDELGGDIFNLPQPDVYSLPGNSVNAIPAVTVDDVNELTASDYRLSYNGTTFLLTRQPENEPVQPPLAPALPATAATPAGGNTATGQLGVTVDDPTALQETDYTLTYDGANYQLTTNPGGVAVPLVADPSDATILVGDGLNFHTGDLAGAVAGDSWTITSDYDPDVLVGDGLRIDTTAIAAAAAGDEWLIQPTRNAASRMTVTMTDPADLAAISGALEDAANTGEADIAALRVTAAGTPETYLPATVVVNGAGDIYNVVSPSYGANAGAATVESFRVLDPKDADLFAAATPITYDSTQQQFVVNNERFALDPSGVTTIRANGWELQVRGEPTGVGPALDAFTINVTPTPAETLPTATTTVTGNGWEMDVRGTPAAYDTFTVDLSRGRPGDARNIQAMAELQDARVVGGETSFQNGYTNILAEVGNETRQAQIARDSSATLLADAQAQRESVSGVNLDEEAANMLRFQQAYQAAAQVIAVTSTLFDTLIAATRR